jgi:hypothetical protein
VQPLGKKQQEMRLRNIKELDFKVYSNLDMIFFLYERRYGLQKDLNIAQRSRAGVSDEFGRINLLQNGSCSFAKF